jgi:penicillin-binding protein 1C
VTADHIMALLNGSKTHRFWQWVAARAGRRVALGLVMMGVAIVLGALIGLRFVPLPAALFVPPVESVELTDRYGLRLRVEARGGGLYSSNIARDDIPRVLGMATIAAEDKRFRNHGGVDVLATLRAAYGFVRHRRVISGGSTITQQLIKLAQPRPRTIRTKVIEAVQAMRLEQLWNKDRILTEYLNRLDYGNLQRGCVNAAQFYFGKRVSELSHAEAALLAGLPQGPSRLNPHRNREPAIRRQQWVLGRMRVIGELDEAQFDFAKDEILNLRLSGRAFHAPHFVELAHAAGIPDEPSIRTSLDLELNREVLSSLNLHLKELADHNVQNGAVVAIENQRGTVRILVGSQNFFEPRNGQINGVWIPRSPGSALKPILYQLAFERGFTPASVLADIPTDFPTATGLYRPVNYDRRFLGPVRARFALANSLNVPAVRLLADISATRFQARLKSLGISNLTHEPDYYGLGLALGNPEVRLLELANAYATLARMGVYRPVSFLEDETAGEGKQILERDACWLVTDILSDDMARSHAFGMDSPLQFDFQVACKTGTSSNFRDNWAFGYTPEFTVGVWVGNFDGTAMQQVSGVAGAGPVLHEVMNSLKQRFGTSWYEQPATVVSHNVHPLTGRLTEITNGVAELFIKDQLPPMETVGDYSETGCVLLAGEYQSWFDSSENHLRDRVEIRPATGVARILSPIQGTVYFLDPDLPASSREIPLRSTSRQLSWKCESLECREGAGESVALMKPGRHLLTASDPATGLELKTWIEVRKL